MPEFTLEELVQASNGTPKKEEKDKIKAWSKIDSGILYKLII